MKNKTPKQNVKHKGDHGNDGLYKSLKRQMGFRKGRHR